MFSRPENINTGRRRHKFFKHIKLVAFILSFVCLGIIVLNILNVVMLEHISLERIKVNIYNVICALILVFLAFQFIVKPANEGIHLFRKGNRDVSKYSLNLTNCKMGFIRIIIVTSIILLLKIL